MGVQLISTLTRPSKDVPWTNSANSDGWHISDPYFTENWLDKGKLLSTVVSFSDDELTVTVIREFIDWQALDDFISDSNLLPTRLARNEYFDQVGIETINIETKEV